MTTVVLSMLIFQGSYEKEILRNPLFSNSFCHQKRLNEKKCRVCGLGWRDGRWERHSRENIPYATDQSCWCWRWGGEGMGRQSRSVLSALVTPHGTIAYRLLQYGSQAGTEMDWLLLQRIFHLGLNWSPARGQALCSQATGCRRYVGNFSSVPSAQSCHSSFRLVNHGMNSLLHHQPWGCQTQSHQGSEIPSLINIYSSPSLPCYNPPSLRIFSNGINSSVSGIKYCWFQQHQLSAVWTDIL